MIAFSDKAAANGAEDSSQSKKARVLCLARSDPFLTVEEIARAVGTTSRYVRTSLSEAGLTLTELRRRFVEDLRQRLREEFGADGPVPDLTPRGPAGSPADGPGSKPAVETRRLRVAQRVDADLAARVVPDTPLSGDQPRLKDGELPYVNQLVTRGTSPSPRSLSAGEPLHHLAQPGQSGELAIVKRTVDIEPASEYIAESLRSKPDTRSSVRAFHRHAQSAAAVEIKYSRRCGCGWSWKRPPGLPVQPRARGRRLTSGARRRSCAAVLVSQPAQTQNTKKRPLRCRLAGCFRRGRETGLEPATPVLETGALPIELLPTHTKVYCPAPRSRTAGGETAAPAAGSALRHRI